MTHSEGFFELQEFILFPLQTIYFHHKPYPDFQTFLKSGLLPCTAHRSLPIHDFFPERNLISDIVIYEPIDTFQATQPLFQFLFLGLCGFPGNCVFLYSLLDYSPCNVRRSDQADSPLADNTLVPFSSNTPPAFSSIFL